MVTKREYLEYIKEYYEKTAKDFDRQMNDWIRRIEETKIFDPPMIPVTQAVLESLFYSVTKEVEYAEKSRELLLTYVKLPGMVSEIIGRNVHPTVNWFNGVTLFLFAYELIKDSGIIKEGDLEKFKRIIGFSLEPLFAFPEWGPHNRAIKRGLALTYAAKMFPDHPKASLWNKLGNILVDASLGHWSLEDSELYSAIWLADILLYIDLVGKDSRIFQSPMLKYYFDYFTFLLCPLGMIPDFGDATWGSPVDLYMMILEKGASVYRDPYMKYAADKIFRFARKEGKFGVFSVFAYLWADDSIGPMKPRVLSREVLDELIGKKIVFRSGWDDDSTYMLLNYMDEGDVGWYYKEHLRNTLVVTAEKMHHGHADENSIVALIYDGAFLLHDGGYREALPDGEYRADIYHNRIVVREGEPANQKLLSFLRNKLDYQQVRTRRVHFKVFRDVDVSRTEVMDERNGYYWDRVVTYLKGLEAFIVHDGVKILRNGKFTLSNLFWTQRIHEMGDEYFDTSIERIGVVGALFNPKITMEQRRLLAWPNKEGIRLLIYFSPIEGGAVSVEESMRCYLPEKCVYQTISKDFCEGEYFSFTTVLWPHGESEDTDKVLDGIEMVKVDRYPNATAIKIRLPDREVTVCAKHNLSIGLVRSNMRPVYTYEDGKIRYDEIVSDAAYIYTGLFSNNTLRFAFIDGMKIFFKEIKLFSSEEPSIIDLSHRSDIEREGYFKTEREYWKYELKTKWDSWEGEVKL
ncbi:MAG: hypothetical protein QW294_05560 [Candidatus Bathyarchaeia archaeon]